MPASASALLAGAVLLALVQFASLPPTPRIFAVLNNFGHGPVFGALALVILFGLRSRHAHRPWLAYGAAFLLSGAAGLAVEVIQIFSPRDASFADVVTNTLGAAGFLCFAAFFDRSLWLQASSTSWRYITLAIAIVLFLVLLFPIGHALAAYWARANQFPTIMQFTGRLDMYFLELRGSEISFERDQTLRIRFVDGEFPGISHLEPEPDWRNFNRLRIDVTNLGDKALELGLRIHDIGHGEKYEDRFNSRFAIAAGSRRVVDVALAEVESSPAGRRLDLARIGGIVLFRLGPTPAPESELLLTRMWLE